VPGTRASAYRCRPRERVRGEGVSLEAGGAGSRPFGILIAVNEPSDLMALLEVEFEERSPTRVTGSVAADERHHQPSGIVHGGLYATAIETFATVGAYEAVKAQGRPAVGVANASDFLRPHRHGRLAVVAEAVHQGRTQQLWQVELRRPDDGKLVARGQVRLQNIDGPTN
jgi:1,4-dihydroxy-2-naphthoyl-CoA hydrolase